ncbi:MAG: hypothetical protein ACOZCP_08550 [Pseudomonadota bacterium]
MSLLKMIKLNGLQYNPNRDPQAYRRRAGETFRLEVVLQGEGEARVVLSAAEGTRLQEARLSLPGACQFELVFPSPGSRIVTLTAEGAGQRVQQDLRLDVLPQEHSSHA